MALFDFGDGKPRELKYTLKALRVFEAAHGKSLWRVRLKGPGELLPELAQDHTCITRAMWVALLHGDPAATFDSTEELMQSYLDSGGDIQAMAKAMADAFDESGLFDSRKKAKGKKPPNAARGSLN